MVKFKESKMHSEQGATRAGLSLGCGPSFIFVNQFNSKVTYLLEFEDES